MDYLTEAQKVKIEVFCKDTELVDGIKKVLLQHIYSQGVLEKGVGHNSLNNRAFSLVQLATTNPIPNEELGANLRGIWEGVNALEKGFHDLTNVKSEKSEPVLSEYNEAI